VHRAMRDTLAVVVPVVATAIVAPFVYSNQLLLFNFIVFLTLAQGINVIYGFTGYLPFGYVGFFGAGAYGFSLAVIHLHVNPFVALGIGAGASLILAVGLIPLLRLSGAYFAIANLAVGTEIDVEFLPPHSTYPIRFAAIVRHRALYLYGIEFQTPVVRVLQVEPRSAFTANTAADSAADEPVTASPSHNRD